MLSEQGGKSIINIPGKTGSKLQKSWLLQECPGIRSYAKMHMQEVAVQEKVLLMLQRRSKMFIIMRMSGL
jgi:hypothetical protein